jgi:hypothetical protein
VGGGGGGGGGLKIVFFSRRKLATYFAKSTHFTTTLSILKMTDRHGRTLLF